MKPHICHLVDDLNPGGVTRLLEFIQGSALMAEVGAHEVVCTGLGAKSLPVTEADIIVSHLSIKWANLPFFLKLRAKYSGRKLIHVEHSYSKAFLEAHVPSKRRFQTLLRTSYAVFDRVVAVSSPQGRWLAEFARIPDHKLRVIPPCVVLGEFLKVAPAANRSVTRIGALGRLHDQKGFDILIEAFAKANLEDVKLEIFGDGPEEEMLKSLANGNPSIRFHGHTEDPIAAMIAVDAIVMPSRREPYGLVALEALAAGRRLLVSGVDGLSDHVQSGAVQVSPNTIDAWTRALKVLCSTRDDARIDQGRAAAKAAEERFASGWADLITAL